MTNSIPETFKEFKRNSNAENEQSNHDSNRAQCQRRVMRFRISIEKTTYPPSPEPLNRRILGRNVKGVVRDADISVAITTPAPFSNLLVSVSLIPLRRRLFHGDPIPRRDDTGPPESSAELISQTKTTKPTAKSDRKKHLQENKLRKLHA